jgi:hypothetical protein
MNANHDQIVWIRVLQLLQLRQNVHAVDAAKRPEVEHHELAFEVLEVDRPAGIDPGGAAIERRRANLAGLKDLVEYGIGIAISSEVNRRGLMTGWLFGPKSYGTSA